MSEQTWTSPVKQRLRAGEPVIAVTITAAKVDMAARAAAACRYPTNRRGPGVVLARFS